MVDWGKTGNPFLEHVRTMSITGPELTPEELELEKMRGPMVAESWEKDPRNPANRKDMTELVHTGTDEDMPRWLVEGDDVSGNNREGSYEALMRGWGGENKKAFATDIADPI